MMILLIFFSKQLFPSGLCAIHGDFSRADYGAASFLEPTHEDETFPMPEPKKVFSLDHHHRSPSTGFTLSLPDLLIYEFSCLYHMKSLYKLATFWCCYAMETFVCGLCILSLCFLASQVLQASSHMHSYKLNWCF